MEPEMETTTENRKRRGYVKKRVKTGRRTTEAPEVTTGLDEQERNSLEDILFNEVESLEEDKFLVALRLSPVPEQLVKGYEFQMLNKFVDIYTLNSQNLTAKYLNATYHHSRLMGVSDIYNSDALIDVVTGLGVPASKIILNTPAFGNSFNLMEPDVNLPGSATTGLAQSLTYQQVCRVLSTGNWTVERDEDLTGPYSFLGNKWISFDDDTSLKIKAKYTLLRGLAGVGLDSIDADDLDNVCGKGRQSLLQTLGDVMTTLQRKPRQLIVTSLEQDLLATAQNVIPVTSSGGIHVSPFRIVRIVDREGQIQSIRQNAETVLECSRQGYYRHPQDCSRFYRCVKFNQYENDYTIFEYGCPEGLVFDDRWEVCVWPAQATPCDGSSEIFPIPKEDYKCPGQGFFVDPENCRWFFACLDHLGDGTFTHYEFRCPFGLAFDEATLRCDWPWLVPACDNTGPQIIGSQPLLPSRAEFAKSFNPVAGGGANSSPFPSVPSIPSFESSRTGRPTPGGQRAGKAFDSNVARESCENCFSNVLTITGAGRVNDNGLEVASPAPHSSGSFGRGGQRLRKPKAETFSSTAAPSYSSSTASPVADGYNYPVPANPLSSPAPPYNPSTSGYDFPAPASPLQLGISVSNPGEAGLRPSYNIPVSVSPNIPAYGLSSTALPSYGVTGGQYSPTPGYASPLSSTYSPPTFNTYKPPTTPSPPSESYGLPAAEPISSYQPAAYDPIVEEYGVPSASPLPQYGAGYNPPDLNHDDPTDDYEYDLTLSQGYEEPVETPYQPSSTYAPVYEPAEEYGVPAAPIISTERPAYQPSSTYAPVYEPEEEYGVPLAPIISTERPAYQPSSTYAPAYEPEEEYSPVYEPAEEYGVPLAPIISTERPAYQPSSTYAPVYEPEEEYGVPLAPIISTERPAYQPSSTYGPPVTPFVTTPRPVYSPSPAPVSVSTSYAPPVAAPAESYGVPLADPLADYDEYQESLPGYGEPVGTYAVPAADTFSGYSPSPSPTPAPVIVSSTYSPPVSLPALPSPPQIQYGGFKPPSVPSPARPAQYQERPAYQQPSYSPTRPDISYGGFRALPSPVTPNIPAYGPASIKSKPGYSYPARPSNPLVLPQTTRKPVYSPTAGYVSTTRGYDDDLPSYGGSVSPLPQYSTTLAPPPPPPAAPQHSSSGYSYPTPANPLELPVRQGRTGPKSKPEVGSVIPVGFSSATLSNGPFSSAPSGGNSFREKPRQQKSFGDSGPANQIRPNSRPAGNINNGNKASGFGADGDNKQNLQSFVSFGPQSGAQAGPRPGSRPRPASSSGPRGNNFGGGLTRPTPGSEEGRGGRLVVDDNAGVRRPSGNQRPASTSQSFGSQRNPTSSPQFSARPTGLRPNQASANNGLRPSVPSVPVSSNTGFGNGGVSRPNGANDGFRPTRPNNAPRQNNPAGIRPNVEGTRGNNFGSNSGLTPNSGFSRPNTGNSRPSIGNSRPTAGNSRPNNGNFRPNTGNSRPNTGNSRPSAGNSRPSAGNSRPSAGNSRPNTGNSRPNAGFSRPNNGGFRQNNSPRPNSGLRQNAGGFRPNGFGGSRPNVFNGGFRPNAGGSRPNVSNGGFRPNAGGSRPNGGGLNESPRQNGGRQIGNNNAARPSSNSPRGRPNGSFNAGRPSGNSNGGRPNGGSRPRDGNNGGRPASNASGAGRPISNGARPNTGVSRPPASSGLSGGPGVTSVDEESRRGKQVGQGVTAISRPTQTRPAVLGKLAPAENNWNSGTWEKFGPGGFRTFNETLGPEVCQRPGLFRHPTDCTQFYECYWDKWIEKFTLHIFPCPVAMAVRQYDESISACNWPFLGPNCEGGTYH